MICRLRATGLENLGSFGLEGTCQGWHSVCEYFQFHTASVSSSENPNRATWFPECVILSAAQYCSSYCSLLHLATSHLTFKISSNFSLGTCPASSLCLHQAEHMPPRTVAVGVCVCLPSRWQGAPALSP